MGRRPKPIPPITQESLDQIEMLAGMGLTVNQIAAIIKLSPRSIRDRKNFDRELTAALTRGRAIAGEKVAQALFQRCMEGDVQAIRWYEQSRMRHSGTAPVMVPQTYDEDQDQDERYL
jgi:hypothetical protein